MCSGEIWVKEWKVCGSRVNLPPSFTLVSRKPRASVCTLHRADWPKKTAPYIAERGTPTVTNQCVCVSAAVQLITWLCFLRASLPPAAFCPMLMTRGHEKSWPLVAPSWCFNNTHATQHIHKEVKHGTESFSFFIPVMSWVECTDSAFF